MADEWPSNVGSYGYDPITTLEGKLLGYLDVGPKSYMEHITKSGEMNVPFDASAQQRVDAAQKKAADFYDRTSLGDEDSALKRALGLSLVLGAGAKHQLGQGIRNIRKEGLLGGRTSDNWAPNFVDWLAGSKTILDKHFGDNDPGIQEVDIWNPYMDVMSYDK